MFSWELAVWSWQLVGDGVVAAVDAVEGVILVDDHHGFKNNCDSRVSLYIKSVLST